MGALGDATHSLRLPCCPQGSRVTEGPLQRYDGTARAAKLDRRLAGLPDAGVLLEQIRRIMSQYNEAIVQNIPEGERAKVLDTLKILRDAIAGVPLFGGQEVRSRG